LLEVPPILRRIVSEGLYGPLMFGKWKRGIGEKEGRDQRTGIEITSNLNTLPETAPDSISRGEEERGTGEK